MTELQIESSTIEIIRRSDFSNLNELLSLKITSYSITNSLEYLAEDAFFDMPNLEQLSIQGGRLVKLHKNTFVKLNKLKDVTIYNNKLKRIEKDLFVNNPMLEKINLEMNELKVIKVDFTIFKNIDYVALHGNECIKASFSSYEAMTIRELQDEIENNCA